MFSKKWLTALVTSAVFFGVGCASSDLGTEETQTGASSQEALLTPCTAIPLAAGSLLGCTAFDTTGIGFAAAAESASFAAASSVQAQLATQLNGIFAAMEVVPNIAASTVTLSCGLDSFTTLFGGPVILPLGVDGFFTGIIPFTVTGLPPLALNVWGQFPIINGAFGTMPLTALNFSVGLATTTAASTMAATSTIAASNALLASTFPLGFACNATVPLSCPGLAPAGFVAPSLVTPLLAPGFIVDP